MEMNLAEWCRVAMKVFPVHAAHGAQQQRAERPDAAALGRREHAAVNAADDEEDAHDGQPVSLSEAIRSWRGIWAVSGARPGLRKTMSHRGHEAQRAEEAGDDPRDEQGRRWIAAPARRK